MTENCTGGDACAGCDEARAGSTAQDSSAPLVTSRQPVERPHAHRATHDAGDKDQNQELDTGILQPPHRRSSAPHPACGRRFLVSRAAGPVVLRSGCRPAAPRAAPFGRPQKPRRQTTHIPPQGPLIPHKTPSNSRSTHVTRKTREEPKAVPESGNTTAAYR
jgi:hypothetical protein